MNISTIIFFVAIVIGTLAITYSAAKRTLNPNDFYVAGNRLTGFQNGLAIAGDYMSAASFLGITGAIALYGYDGFYYSIGFLVSYLVVLIVIAEPMYNLGKYTVADAIATRFQGNGLRGLLALNTITISIFYMTAQLVGAGALIHLMLDIEYTLAVLIVGSLMTIYVVFGGMVAASWVQIVKATLLLTGTLIVSCIVFSRFDWSIASMFSYVASATSLGEAFLAPGNLFKNPLDTLSLQLSLILGTAGLPHIIVRLFTVKDVPTVRYSVITAMWVIGSFYIMTIFLGFGAASFVPRDMLLSVGEGGNLAAVLLAKALGGEFLMAFVSAVAFATILAVVSGLVISASSAFAHDIYNQIFRKGKAGEREQMYTAKWSAMGVGLFSILLALGAQHINVAFLVALTFATAASANLPVIVFTLYWRDFNVGGAVTGALVGLLSSIILVISGPNVMNPMDGWIKAEAFFPLSNPGIVSIPLGFIGAAVGTFLYKKKEQATYEEVEELAFLGIDKRS
jgi:cation/acetate symporter